MTTTRESPGQHHGETGAGQPNASQTPDTGAQTASSLLTTRQCIFIIGAMRSGNTWLYNMLAHHPDVLYEKGETTLFSDYVKSLEDAWESEMRLQERDPGARAAGISNKITEKDFTNLVSLFIHGFYQLLETGGAETHYIEKRPKNAYVVDAIKKYIPNAKFIHIIRDGRNMTLSAMSTHERFGWGAPDVSAGAELWKDRIRAARAVRDSYPADYLEVRYEELLEDCKNRLRRIFDFCELPCTDDFLDEVSETYHFSRAQVSRPTPGIERNDSNKREGWQTRLSAGDRYLFHRRAGGLLIELGYAEPGWWHNGPVNKLLVFVCAAAKGFGRRCRRAARVLRGIE